MSSGRRGWVVVAVSTTFLLVWMQVTPRGQREHEAAPELPISRTESALPLATAYGAQPTHGAHPASAHDAPWPASGLPLAAAIDALEIRARRGEVAAMKHLSSELDRCAWTGLSPRTRTDAEYCLTRAHCAGVAPARFPQRWEWLFRAATMGDAHAQLVFAQGLAMLVSDPLRASDWLPVWRQHALSWVQDLVAQGHPDALWIYAKALESPDRQGTEAPLASLVTHDPVHAHALLHALSLSPVRETERGVNWSQWRQTPGAGLTPAQLQQARQQGEAIYDRFRARMALEPLSFNRLILLFASSDHNTYMQALAERHPQCGWKPAGRQTAP